MKSFTNAAAAVVCFLSAGRSWHMDEPGWCLAFAILAVLNAMAIAGDFSHRRAQGRKNPSDAIRGEDT